MLCDLSSRLVFKNRPKSMHTAVKIEQIRITIVQRDQSAAARARSTEVDESTRTPEAAQPLLGASEQPVSIAVLN